LQQQHLIDMKGILVLAVVAMSLVAVRAQAVDDDVDMVRSYALQ